MEELIKLLVSTSYADRRRRIVGKGVLALSAAAIFVSMAAVIRRTRPIEYKR